MKSKLTVPNVVSGFFKADGVPFKSNGNGLAISRSMRAAASGQHFGNKFYRVLSP
jgi:hypothetical protein